jgi:hypothetical protein
LRLGEREWAKENAVDKAKDGGVGADAEGQGENRDESEGRIFAEHAGAVAKILEKSFEPREGARVTGRFQGLLGATELDESAATGFRGGHAGLEIVGDGFVEVGRDLGGEIDVELVSAEEGDEAMKKLAEVHGWASLEAGRRRDKKLPLRSEGQDLRWETRRGG